MKITEVAGGATLTSEVPRFTDEELQCECNYLLAEHMAKNMLQAGLITGEELSKIMEKCRDNYAPVFSRVGPKSLDSSGVLSDE